MRHLLRAALALFCIHSLCCFQVHAVAQRSSIRRERLLRPEFGNSLSLLHSSFLPQGEVADRISGNERLRGFGAITGRPGNRFLPDRRDSIITSKAAAALGAGIASVAGWAVDSPVLSITKKGTKPPQPTGAHTSRAPKAAQSQCSQAAQQLFDVISSAVNATRSNTTRGFSKSSTNINNSRNSVSFLAQPGYIDFGLTGSQDSQAPCQPNCAFSNPTSSYGLTVLPLSPAENLTAKVSDDQTPAYVKQNLDGRYGAGMAPAWQLQQDEVVVLAGCTPPEEASRYFGVTGYVYSTYSNDSSHWINVFASLGDSASITTISVAAPPAAAWQQQQQQQQEEDDTQKREPSGGFQITAGRLKTSKPISNSTSSGSGGSSSFEALTIVLLGANPDTVAAAADTIRGSIAAFVTTAAAAAAKRHATSSNGHSVLLSAIKQDYINVIPIPGPLFSKAIGLNSTSNYYTLIVRNIAPSGQEGPTAFESYVEHPHFMAWRLTPVNYDGSRSSYAGKSSKGSGAVGSSSSNGSYGLPQVIPRQTSHDNSSSSSSSQPAVYLSVGSFSTSSRGSITAANYTDANTSSDGSVYKSSSDPSNAVGTGCGNANSTVSAVCLLHVRVAGAVAAGVGDAINNLLVAQPAVVESLRDTGYDANDTTEQGVPISSTGSSSSSSSSGNDTRGSTGNSSIANPEADDKADNMNQTESAKQRLHVIIPSLQQQQHMLDLLLTAIDLQYNSSYAISHGLGSAAPLALLGVDWGADCMNKTLDWCNGDNRDATYLSSLPLFNLNRPGQLLVVVGVNYVTAGVGSYMNVAVTDPVQQLGLRAFDDVELAAAAVPWPAAAAAAVAVPRESGSHSSGALRAADDVLQKLMYLVAFSRNCTGVSMPCKEIAPGGQAKGAPLSRPLMMISRVYVNPATGVGPDPRDLNPSMTLLLTPRAVAVPADSVPRTDMGTWAKSVTADYDVPGRYNSSFYPLNDTIADRAPTDNSSNTRLKRQAMVLSSKSQSSDDSESETSTVNSSSSGDSAAPAAAAPAAAAAGRAKLSREQTRLSNLPAGLPGRRFRSQNVLGLQQRVPQLPAGTSRWSNAKGDFDPAAAAQATQCPASQPAAAANMAADAVYDSSTGDGSNSDTGGYGTAARGADSSSNVVVFDRQLQGGDHSSAPVSDASSLIKQTGHVNDTSSSVVTTAQAATDACVRALVGMSQCSGKGSPDVCCSYVQAWSEYDCWCRESGRVLLSSMPAVLTPPLLQLLSWVCEAQ